MDEIKDTGQRLSGSERKSSVEKAAAKLAGAGMQHVDARGADQSGTTVRPPAAATPKPGKEDISAEKGSNGADASGRSPRRVKIDMDNLRASGIVTGHAEGSLVAEEFRLIKRPLLLSAFDRGPAAIRNGNLIMVASASANEGKTFCTTSLAMSIALERDLTVMLVDADLAKPNIPGVLGFEAERGLVDVLADDTIDVADVLVRTDLDNLTILPAGRPHHLATELLASERMERIVDEIAQRYSDRVIIFDSPPVLMSSIPSVLALHVGQIVFVVQADQTTQGAVDTALGLISACNNIYLLLNKARAVGEADNFGAYYGYSR